MKIHEFQAKQLLNSAGVPVPVSYTATNPWQARYVAELLHASAFVVKAQIHAGGRGKGGGVAVVQSLDEVYQASERILGMTLVTKQTGPEGRLVRTVLIEPAAQIARELYFAVLIDRSSRCLTLMASEAGGMEIEQVAEQRPEAIVKIAIDPLVGVSARHGRALAQGLGIEHKGLIRQFTKLAIDCCNCFINNDLSLLEINPLAITQSDELLAVDAKMTIDDNAMFRHPELAELRDFNEEQPLEILSSRYGVDYVKLDGDIGCMVNGAGLAMATMDLIMASGAMPANFLDIKGGADVANVVNAFELLNSDPNVRAVLINIFGGIVRCDMVAEGILKAMQSVKVEVPIVVRIEGTNADLGAKMLADSPYGFISAKGLSDAARKVVAARGDA
ncbi:MAG: ADP-forming succinate--CoA ligase subunit beta [Candidatus Alcyoniella australis]|nr:ADP-forming succinate--CoA ligase subunit beta [Candidatus Alcyoniella australis]